MSAIVTFGFCLQLWPNGYSLVHHHSWESPLNHKTHYGCTPSLGFQHLAPICCENINLYRAFERTLFSEQLCSCMLYWVMYYSFFTKTHETPSDAHISQHFNSNLSMMKELRCLCPCLELQDTSKFHFSDDFIICQIYDLPRYPFLVLLCNLWYVYLHVKHQIYMTSWQCQRKKHFC